MALLKVFRARRILAVAAGLLLLCHAARAQGPDAGEKAIKAAFLYNFTKFVEWPAAAFDSEAAPFRVCVFADQAFRREIEAMLSGEAVGKRPLRVVTPEPRDAKACHLAYFGRSETDRAAQLLPAIKQAPVLTVGEGQRFLAQGGLISFVVEDNRVRFDVNKQGVDRTGLTVSSKLLRVARHVDTGGPRLP